MGNAIVPPKGDEGLSALVAWVKAYKAQPGVVFDTGLRCESDGGEVFYFDPEEAEEWADLIDEIDPRFRRFKSKYSEEQGTFKVEGMTPPDAVLLAREHAILSFLEQLIRKMREDGVTQDAVAKAMGVSKARVSQLMNGPNFTFETAARMAHAVGLEFAVVLRKP